MFRELRSVVAAPLAAAAVLLVLVTGCGREQTSESPAPPSEPPIPGKSVPKPEVSIDTEFGRIVVELFPDEAPMHVDQFLDLVESGFYDGTTFHRVVPGFLIQGGDPNTKDDDPENDGYGGLEDRRLPLEVSDRLTFRRGTLGMARDYRPDGASCQFFITLGRASHLDGEYTIMGRAIGGLDVIDIIGGVETDEGRHPLEPIPVLSMRVVDDPRAGSSSSGDEDLDGREPMDDDWIDAGSTDDTTAVPDEALDE